MSTAQEWKNLIQEMKEYEFIAKEGIYSEITHINDESFNYQVEEREK